MMKCKKILLPLLCVLALMVGMLAPLSALADTAAPAEEEMTAIDRILERDGYLEGIWYPWFDWWQIGCNLVDNSTMESVLGSDWWKSQAQYQGGLDRYGADRVYCDLVNMKAIGFNIIGFGASMYGEGIVYDDNGDVIGIEEDYLRAVRRVLDICRDVGVALMWNVHFHSEGLSDDYVNGKNAWDIISQMICNPEVTEHFVDRFVRPLCQVLAQYPDVVVMGSAMDESDNIINDSDIGDHFDHRELYGVTEAALVNFIDCVTDAMKEEMPGIEMMLAGNSSDFSRYSDVDLDFLGRSIYSDDAGFASVESYNTSVPVLATEFGMVSVLSEERYSALHIQKRQKMIQLGYKGWFMWCWQSNRGGGHHDVMLEHVSHFTDFRPAIFDLNHFIQDYRAEYRGEELVMDTPAMFYNAGDGKVVWIGARQATYMDLLRSDDGGKTWKKLLDNVNVMDYQDENGKGVYIDTTAPKSGYMYKVVVRDDDGNEAESEPTNEPEDAQELFDSKDYSGPQGGMVNNNPAKLPNQATEPAVSGVTPLVLSSYGTSANRPNTADKNLIINGSFESAEGAQWNVDTFLGSTVSVVEDDTTRSGNKSLYFNSSGVNKAAWHVFWLDVEPNTDYTFSAWVKGAFISDDNRYCASVGVIDPDSKQFMKHNATKISTTTRQIVPTAWDNEWHLRSVAFNSKEKTKIGIALYGHSSQMWVDDIALFKSGDGSKYINPDLAGGIITKLYLGADNCLDADNMVGDSRMDDVTAAYWQEGDGWKNGFISVNENTREYGNSLKYTAGDALGYRYLRWVELKPNTEYVFSVDIKILKSGNGRFALSTRTVKGSVSFLNLDFDQDLFGDQWFPYATSFNSGNHNRIALTVVDLGGEALIDNIRIFEKSKAVDAEDEYLEDKDGWVEDDFGWLYYEEGRKVFSKWVSYNGGWYYMDEDGYMVSNCWKKDSVGWCYLAESGKMATNKWIKDSVGWCYVGDNGYCVTNKWVKDSIGWCYLDDQGRMATNRWIKDSVGWCYVGADGYCVTNCWKKDSKGWCYLDEQGRMAVNRWVRDSKGWCYVGGDGYAVTNCWKKDSVGWCYLDGEGSMTKNDWVSYNGDWYYLDQNGYMVAGKTLTIDGTTYTFDSNGALK